MNKQDFIRVDEWAKGASENEIVYKNPKDEIVRCDGKLLIIPFDEIFKKGNKGFNVFVIKKDSYVKQLPEIALYINYFIKFYDTDNELLMAYLMLKHQIDNKKKRIKRKVFIKMLYSVLFTESMKEKINRMVEDNYYIDLKSKNNIKYAETLEFTNEHAKIMMKISMGMKLMVPVLFHYINRNNIIKDKETPLFIFYEHLFYMWDDKVDIYLKLRITVESKIKRHYSNNSVIWNQREIMGMDPLIYMDTLLKENIISETMVKYRFHKNIISFNSVVLDKQLGFFSITPYNYTMRELTTTKDSEGLSGIDKLEMNSAKIDESLVILSSVNIKKTIKKIKKRFGIDIDKDELRFYEQHHTINKFQVQLVGYFYAKYFGGYRDINLLTRSQYIKLMLILKKRLQYQGFIYLPMILSGNVEKLIKRTIQNQKFLEKVRNSPVYQSILQEKFGIVVDELNKNNIIINLLSILLNSHFTIVDYDYPEKLGNKIEINTPDILSDEFLNFLNQI